MSKDQKRTAWIVAILGLFYFVVYIFPNNMGAKDEHMLFVLSTDEHITYPYTLQMVTPGNNLYETLYGWIAYQDYHYGYPFYLYSALVILPVRLVFSDAMVEHTQLSLLLLRQFVNVLPMTLLIILLVYLQTRFKSRIKSVLLFLFLATIQGVFRSNIQWWHPDSLAILAVVFTFFFLDRDRLRFGKNFYYAALFCGLAVGIKMIGFFFFFTIAGYLLIGIIQRYLDVKRAARSALIFLFIMAASIIISNPLLLPERSRSNIFRVQDKIRYETTHGWSDEDVYETGISAWLPYLKRWYGNELFFGLAAAALIAGCFVGNNRFLNRLIIGWVVPYSFYLLFFIAVKPDHYWLPVILPWFSSMFSWMPDSITSVPQTYSSKNGNMNRWLILLICVALVIISSQFIVNMMGDIQLYHSAMIQEELLRLNIHQ